MVRMAATVSRGLRAHNRGGTLKFVPSHVLLRTPELTLGEFVCAPGDPRGTRSTRTWARGHMWSSRAAGTDRPGRCAAGADVAEPRRVLPAAPASTGAGCVTRAAIGACGSSSRPRSSSCRTCRPGRAMRGRICWRWRWHSRGADADPLVAEEAALLLLDRTLRARAWSRPTPCADPRRAFGPRGGGEGAARGEPRTLAEVAAALYVSPFHLARVFRARTGFSMAGYVQRAAVAAGGRAPRGGARTSTCRGSRSSSATARRATSRSLPGGVRRAAVCASRDATEHDRGSGAAARRLEPPLSAVRRGGGGMLAAVLAAAALGVPAAHEQPVRRARRPVLQTWHGEANGYFGWAVSELRTSTATG